jgi:hypothetical protein
MALPGVRRADFLGVVDPEEADVPRPGKFASMRAAR